METASALLSPVPVRRLVLSPLTLRSNPFCPEPEQLDEVAEELSCILAPPWLRSPDAAPLFDLAIQRTPPPSGRYFAPLRPSTPLVKDQSFQEWSEAETADDC